LFLQVQPLGGGIVPPGASIPCGPAARAATEASVIAKLRSGLGTRHVAMLAQDPVCANRLRADRRLPVLA